MGLRLCICKCVCRVDTEDDDFFFLVDMIWLSWDGLETLHGPNNNFVTSIFLLVLFCNFFL